MCGDASRCFDEAEYLVLRISADGLRSSELLRVVNERLIASALTYPITNLYGSPRDCKGKTWAKRQVNCCLQGKARFQNCSTWKRDSAILHKPRSYDPGQRFAGADPIYLL